MQLKLGPQIEKEKIVNKWVINFSSMSGDGDSYEITTHMFDNPFNMDALLDDMMKIIRVYSVTWTMGHDRYDEDKVLEQVKAVGELFDIEDAEDLYSELVGHDITCEGRMAAADEIWLTHFDPYGDEYFLTLHFDGKVFMNRITESNVKEIIDAYDRHVAKNRT